MAHVWSAILLIVPMIIVGCHVRRPDFMTRVREDCAARQQWACDLLDALARPPSTDDTRAPDIGQEAPLQGPGVDQ